MQFQPLDIIAVDARWYMPHHWPIRQRGAGDRAVHNAIVLDPSGTIENVDFLRGPHLDHIDHFKGRNISIHRIKRSLLQDETDFRLHWLKRTREASRGYDYRQLLAAYLGIPSDKFVEDETSWTCSERAYWLWQETGMRITEIDDILPHPRWVRYNDHFAEIFRGVW